MSQKKARNVYAPKEIIVDLLDFYNIIPQRRLRLGRLYSQPLRCRILDLYSLDNLPKPRSNPLSI